MEQATPYPGTQAVLRAIALLKAFTSGESELSLSELARRVRLNKTTAFRLMTALESEGMVMRNPSTDAYRLGPEAIVLGGHAQRSNDLIFSSRAELESLAEETGEMVTLEVLVDESVVVMAEITGRYVLSASQTVGTRWPASKTSTGKVMLAYLSDEQLRHINLPDDLRDDLPTIRQQGYAIADGELEEDFVAISAPIRNYLGQVIAAISAGGPSTRFNPQRVQEVAAMVKQTAATISQHLGYRS